jgi:uncharacterized membrane protein YphA (DoxX/SURF4 family)
MLTLFPSLLSYSFFVPTLLRIAAGLVFLYLAYFHYTNRRAVAEEIGLFIGGARIICILYSMMETLVAIGLIAGVATQLAALVGFAIAAKVLFLRRSLHDLKPFPPLTYALLAVICVSLVIMGAGAFSFDLPL